LATAGTKTWFLFFAFHRNTPAPCIWKLNACKRIVMLFFYLCIWRQEQQLKPPWIESQIG
jgi:hypothetical protein